MDVAVVHRNRGSSRKVGRQLDFHEPPYNQRAFDYREREGDRNLGQYIHYR